MSAALRTFKNAMVHSEGGPSMMKKAKAAAKALLKKEDRFDLKLTL
jgi:hypothetical protein